MRISDWSSDVCSSDLALILSKDLPRARTVLEAIEPPDDPIRRGQLQRTRGRLLVAENRFDEALALFQHELETADSITEDAGFYRMWALDGISRSQTALGRPAEAARSLDRKSTRPNSSHSCATRLPSSARQKNT